MMPGLWEFFFKYPPVVFEKGQLIFASPLPATLLFISTAAVVGMAGWTYARARGKMRGLDRAMLVTLRTAAFAVLLFMLFRPTLQIATSIEQENYVAVLIDDSRSMRIADGAEGVRGDLVREALGPAESSVLNALSERYKVRYFRFAGGAERMEGLEDLTFTGGQSRLGRALDQVRSQLSGVPLAGLVMITDGADQAEAELNSAVLGLRAASVPVFTVGVGREAFERDVEVRRVATPRSVLRGSTVVVDAVVAQTGFRGQTVQLVVEDEGRIVTAQEVQLPSDGTPAAVPVHFTANEAGTRRFRFRVMPLAGELLQDNNHQDALIEVREGPEKILYIEGEPRWEVAFMRRAIADDTQLQLVLLNRTAENKFYRLGVDSGEELANGFPRTREELFSYRALIIGSVEASFFSREQLEMIRDFVGQRGGGFLMLGGRKAFSEGGYVGTPVADLLPVELEPNRDTTFFAEVTVAPTRAGLVHPVLQLGADPYSSSQRWQSLPALSTFNRVTRVKPGATTLLTGASSRGGEGQVVLAHQRYGRGMALALPIQDSWTWQMHVDIPLEDETHQTFWKQILRWLVSETPDPLTVIPSTEQAAVNQPMMLQAELRDDAFRPVNGARLVAHLTDPEGTVREFPMQWSAQRDGEYQLGFTPTVPGQHQVRVDAVHGETTRSRTLLFEAAEDGGEFFGAQMRAPLLRRIAEETGGRFYTVSDLRRLPEDIRYSGQGITRTEQLELWDMPIVFLLAVGLIAAEWGYRRKRGLP
jgi:uncharacterized membrane protein